MRGPDEAGRAAALRRDDRQGLRRLPPRRHAARACRHSPTATSPSRSRRRPTEQALRPSTSSTTTAASTRRGSSTRRTPRSGDARPWQAERCARSATSTSRSCRSWARPSSTCSRPAARARGGGRRSGARRAPRWRASAARDDCAGRSARGRRTSGRRACSPSSSRDRRSGSSRRTSSGSAGSGPSDPPGHKGWTQHLAALRRRATRLTKLDLKEMHVRDRGTDLRLRIAPFSMWRGGGEQDHWGRQIAMNVPTEECFISPDAAATEGTFRCSRPRSFGGRVIEELSGEFRGGRLVRLKAKREADRDWLARYLAAIPNADRLGEIALALSPCSLDLAGGYVAAGAAAAGVSASRSQREARCQVAAAAWRRTGLQLIWVVGSNGEAVIKHWDGVRWHTAPPAGTEGGSTGCPWRPMSGRWGRGVIHAAGRDRTGRPPTPGTSTSRRLRRSLTHGNVWVGGFYGGGRQSVSRCRAG